MTSIFVAKLDYGVSQEELKRVFEQFGKVAKVSIPIDKETGKPKGFAFVEMFNHQEALDAVKNLDESNIRGRQIAVKLAEDRSGQRNQQRADKTNTPFKKEENHFQKSEKTVTPIDPSIVIPLKVLDNKKEPVKKKEKDKKYDYNDGSPRPKKMQTYKKSGKNNRFFDMDDDDEF